MDAISNFFSSKGMKDLANGELPEVKVSLTTEGLVNIGLTAFFVFVSAVVVSQIIKKLSV